MWRWGMDWQWSEDDLPLQLVDRETGAEVVPAVVDATTGEPMDIRKLRIRLRRDAAPTDAEGPQDLIRRRLAGTP